MSTTANTPANTAHHQTAPDRSVRHRSVRHRSERHRSARRSRALIAAGVLAVSVVPTACQLQVGPCTIVWLEPATIHDAHPNPNGGAAGGIASLILSLIPLPLCGEDQPAA